MIENDDLVAQSVSTSLITVSMDRGASGSPQKTEELYRKLHIPQAAPLVLIEW